MSSVSAIFLSFHHKLNILKFIKNFSNFWLPMYEGVDTNISTANVSKPGKVMFLQVFVNQFLIDGDREQ